MGGKNAYAMGWDWIGLDIHKQPMGGWDGMGWDEMDPMSDDV